MSHIFISIFLNITANLDERTLIFKLFFRAGLQKKLVRRTKKGTTAILH